MALWVLWATYGSFYLCRTNLSAALPGIESEFGYSKTDMASVLISLKLAYGIGQLINGQLAEKSDPISNLTELDSELSCSVNACDRRNNLSSHLSNAFISRLDSWLPDECCRFAEARPEP